MKSESKILDEEIDSFTFLPTGEKLCVQAAGVYVYKDQGGNPWAIKTFSPNDVAQRQMEERGWTEEDVMRKEAISLDAAAYHVVPRLIERDRTGRMYIAMPVYNGGDLSTKISNLTMEESLRFVKDIAVALKYIHSQKEDPRGERPRTHGDVKPSNILIENGRAYLGDLGSTTCISIGGSGSKRGSYGDINYRAPECFAEDSRPSKRADVWGLGAILYESVTKKGIYEGINIDTLGTPKFSREIKKRINKAPRKLRPFLRKCLAVNEGNRFYDGGSVLKNLEEVIEKLDFKKVISRTIKKWTVPIGLPIILSGLFAYGAATYEPKKVEMPRTQIQGMVYPPEKLGNILEIELEREQINDLPKDISEGGAFFSGLTHNAKLSTDNRVVAYFLKTHAQTQFSGGATNYPEVYTDNQFRTFIAYTSNDERQFNRLSGTPWPVWAKSIEVALNQAKIGDKKVDLEDVMTISRVGPDLVSQAKRVSGSFDYEVYRNAKGVDGKLIIPKQEQKFINYWLSYYHADID
ncbi:MAG: protein kinase [Candidatus Pacearchaeota archaeon]